MGRWSGGKVIGGDVLPGEIEAVEMATQLFLDGKSYREIAKELDKSPYRPRNSEQWSETTIRKMMTSDFYAGFVTFDDVRNKEPSSKYPALWDSETHTAITNERIRRKPGGKPHKSILSGCVFCIRCEKSMRVSRPYKDRDLVYFMCSVHAKKSETGVPCHTNYVREYVAIDAVEAKLDYIRQMNRGELIEMLQGSGDSERDKLLAEQESVTQAIGKDQDALGRLAQAIAAGALSIAACAVENDKITGRLEAAQKRLDEIDAALLSYPSVEERIARVSELVDMPIDLYEVDVDQGRLVLLRAGVCVWCESGQVKRVEIG